MLPPTLCHVEIDEENRDVSLGRRSQAVAMAGCSGSEAWLPWSAKQSTETARMTPLHEQRLAPGPREKRETESTANPCCIRSLIYDRVARLMLQIRIRETRQICTPARTSCWSKQIPPSFMADCGVDTSSLWPLPSPTRDPSNKKVHIFSIADPMDDTFQTHMSR